MIDLTHLRIGQLDRSNRPTTPCGLSSPASEKYVRQADFRENYLTNFLELRNTEVQLLRISHPGTSVNNVGCSAEGSKRRRMHAQRRAGQAGYPSTPAPDLPACPTLWVASGQKDARPLLAARGSAPPRGAACGRRHGARGMVRSDDARSRHYDAHQQARIQPGPRGAVPLQPQPRLPLSDDALRWDSSPQERFVGHPTLAVGALCDPARSDRARGALLGTHFR